MLQDFLKADEIEGLKKDCSELIDGMDPKEHNTVFSGATQVLLNHPMLQC